MPNQSVQASSPNSEQAIRNPASRFASPEQLVADCELTSQQKIQALRCWAYDAAEMEVAHEEGMRNGEDDLLRRILIALTALGDIVDVEHVGPSKQHGLPPRSVP
jgi:hypothetical protein